jgi:TolB-like protein/DNA-binding SARP family transcriptional activator
MGTAADGESGAPARWSLCLFGGFELRTLPDGERVAVPGKRERVLLAYLALSPNARRSRSKLATLLWGDGADDTALEKLRTCLWSLRKALGDSEHRVLVSDGEHVVLDAARFDVDVLSFQRHASLPDSAALEAAAGLYGGKLLDGLDIDAEDFEEWRRLEAGRYEDRAADVLLRLMAARSEAGETERAIEAGVRLLRLEPLHEAAVRRLMRLYRDAGRRGAAIDVYRALAATLRTDLDAEPDAETRAVFAEVARSVEDRPAQPSAPEPTLLGRETADALPPQSPPPLPAPPRRAPLRSRVVAAAAAALVLAAIAVYRLVAPADDGLPEIAAEQLTAANPPAIAVLPFANLSGDASQEFFSDGMTEEVTAALVKVPSMRVVARTSAFQFKGQGEDVRKLARSLGASHLVEGSVRRSGTRVRINAQLIEAASGTNLWAESYEREFDDMFAIQDDIAAAIAEALRIPLGLEHDEHGDFARIGDLDTYQTFLRARAMVHLRGYGSLSEAAASLEQVVASDPGYAPAWAYLAQAHVFSLNYHPAWLSGDFELFEPIVDASLPKAEDAARRAVDLASRLADGYAILGLTRELRGGFAEAEDLYRKALALDPTNPDALHFYSRLHAEVGRLRESLELRRQLQSVDPFVPVYNHVTSWLYWLNGDVDAALALDATLPPFYRGYSSPRLLASVGRYEEAVALLRTNAEGMFLPGVVEAAAELLSSAPAVAASPEALPRLGWFNFVYVHVGAPSRALEFYEGGVEAGYSVSISNALLWHPYYAELRKTERYKDFMRKRGVVTYWHERGWPELCRPVEHDDFQCD